MKKKIIVVEDDDDTLFMVVTVLQSKGYEVLGLKDGSSLMDEHFVWPDLFILDKGMEFHNGITITNYLKSKQQGKEVPVLLISGSISSKDAEAAGVDQFLLKPLDTEHLLCAVEQLIASSAEK